MVLYDTIGRSYRATRTEDPTIAAAIADALGDAESVINIGAGTGSYEPKQTVLAVEPSRVMIEQRGPARAPAVRGCAERIPVADKSVDAAMAVLTVHHWSDVAAGVLEMKRIARKRVVIFGADPEVVLRYWLFAEYLPAAALIEREQQSVPVTAITDQLPGAEVRTVETPYDCIDGFGAAFWRRPEAYLDPAVRAGISFLAKADEATLRPGLQKLADDVESGRWHTNHADLLALDSMDVGCRLVIAEL
jgi:SAM-dependent methyltransferase